MLDYVIDLLDEATDFTWASAKVSHACAPMSDGARRDQELVGD